MISYVAQILEELHIDKPFAALTEDQRSLQAMLMFLKKSQRFKLPKNGVLLEDKKLRALPRGCEIRMPYICTALEYDCDDTPGVSKTVILIIEMPAEEETVFLMYTFVHMQQKWVDVPIPVKLKSGKGIIDADDASCGIEAVIDPKYVDKADVLFGAHVDVLLDFLNALACSNVKVGACAERLRSKDRQQGILEDSYHQLTVVVGNRAVSQGDGSGTHASPREHIRRGHIRRMQTGKTLWINEMVVNAGRGLGKIDKTYNLKARQ